jgi:hypothetical protein
MLLFPIDFPQLEKRVTFVKDLPQDLKILFRVANAHSNDLLQQRRRVWTASGTIEPLGRSKAEVPFSGQGARSGISFTMSSEPAS